MSLTLDKKIDAAVSDKAVEIHAKDPNFKQFIKAFLYMLDGVLEQEGPGAGLEYFLNMRDSKNKPWRVDINLQFKKSPRKEIDA